MYTDDQMLPLSGIQHYVFCPRQWALIHIEQLWCDNALTTHGSLLHSRVDNPFERESNGSDAITLRGLSIASYRLGLSGVSDAVEVWPHSDAPPSKELLLQSRAYDAIPVEYKRGVSKVSHCDRLQVTAQAMALEEMLGIDIHRGAIFYWSTRHREYIQISSALREMAQNMSDEMHLLFEQEAVPKAIWNKGCRSCSLVELCVPRLVGRDVKRYLTEYLFSPDSE